MSFFEQLQIMTSRHAELGQLMSQPDAASDQNRFTQLSREYADLSPIVEAYAEYRELETQRDDAETMASEAGDDPEMKEMAREELESLKEQLTAKEKALQLMLLPKDPNDVKNTILEIRAGTGGDEAALFANDLFRMYTKFAETKRWKVEILSSSPTPIGGMKEIVALVTGKNVFSDLKFESGVHRVQRVPTTEAGGRIHTSACTVAILPEAEEVEVNIADKDLRVDVFRASGPGGQSVNTTDSAIRITHLPTGLVVICQDEKSQLKNKAKAMKVLHARLLDRETQEAADARSEERKGQVGSGDRSERIRTYNFPQARVTDHRINLTLHKLDQVMEGGLDEVVKALQTHHQAELLATLGAEAG